MKNNAILKKHEGIKHRFEELAQQITAPEVMADMKRYVCLTQEYRHIEGLLKAFDTYRSLVDSIEDAKQVIAGDEEEELKEMARLELDEATEKAKEYADKIRLLLIPPDPEDAKNAILEIRAGTGGDEASIFAGDLFRMYSKFCDTQGWKMEVTSITEGTVGGYKEIVAKISGEGVYGILKYESGVHRVQRIPQTETQGRVHTSAASVAVLPEADEVDIDLKESDIRKDTYCSSGPGGQSVNTTYSAVRLTHTPTGIVVTCQDEKSQIKNLTKAMNELRTRLYDIERQKHLEQIASKRKTMVSTGDRSAKIRTYNYPQGRVTEHRIGLTRYNLPDILNGHIREIIEKLQFEENAEKLKENEQQG